jgi:YggT family protein
MKVVTSLFCVCAALLLGTSSAFVALHTATQSTARRTTLSPSLTPPLTTAVPSSSRLKMVDASLASSVIVDTSLILAETEAWVRPTATFLDIFTNLLSLAMLIRVVLSWYPKMNLAEFPWIVVVLPTEPLLKAIRGSVPPAFGVDITPIVWLGFFTFIHEILLGQQGLLTMKIKYGI